MALNANAETSKQLANQQSMTIKAKNAHETVSKRVTELSDKKVNIESSLRTERLKTKKLQKDNKSLKANLQAKKKRQAEEARLASVKPVVKAVKATQPAPTVKVTGNKASWLAASGIPEAHWGMVDSIVTRESGWNPNAVNASSGACGLGQQLPCGKWSGAWNDPVAALRAMTGYVDGRYGGWPQAVAFWEANNWY